MFHGYVTPILNELLEARKKKERNCCSCQPQKTCNRIAKIEHSVLPFFPLFNASFPFFYSRQLFRYSFNVLTRVSSSASLVLLPEQAPSVDPVRARRRHDGAKKGNGGHAQNAG